VKSDEEPCYTREQITAYFHMEIKEGTSVEEHIKIMKEFMDRLATINAPLLGCLLSTYSTLVTALETRDTITLNYTQRPFFVRHID